MTTRIDAVLFLVMAGEVGRRGFARMHGPTRLRAHIAVDRRRGRGYRRDCSGRDRRHRETRFELLAKRFEDLVVRGALHERREPIEELLRR